MSPERAGRPGADNWLGGGLRLLPDGVSGAWDLASSTTLPDGALGLYYQRR